MIQQVVLVYIYLGGQPEQSVTQRGRLEETSGREIGGHDSLRLVEGLLSTLLWHLCPMQFALPLFSCTLFIAPQYILSRFFAHRNFWGFVGHLTAPQLIRLINNPCRWDTMSFVWSFHSVLFHSVPFCFIPFRSVALYLHILQIPTHWIQIEWSNGGDLLPHRKVHLSQHHQHSNMYTK